MTVTADYRRIRPARGTAASWETSDRILEQGELAVELAVDGTPKSLKTGDGVTPTNDLVGLPVGAEVISAPESIASVGLGAGLFIDDPEPWFTDSDDEGLSFTIGNRKSSIGFAGQPLAAPATSIGSGGFSFPLANGSTVPVSDCAALNQYGGSFKVGGHVVVYTGRSTASGAGNATGCYSLPSATGTVSSGTALGFETIGWGPARFYHVFGENGTPVPGSTQGVFGITRYEGPTVNDSAEGWSHAVIMVGSHMQNRPVTGGEIIAQIAGSVALPGGYGGPLLAGGARTNTAESSRASNVIGYKLSHNSDGGGTGYTDEYDGIYQSSSALESYGTVNGAVTSGSNKTITFQGATKRPPTPTTGFPGRVLIGGNADGMGGRVITYTGITGTGTTGTLTGATVAVDIASGERISNSARAINARDQIITTAGFGAGASGYSGSFLAAVHGNEDSARSMVQITGPSNTEITGGLLQLRINAGVGQTRQMTQWYDTGGTNRLSVTAAGQIIANGSAINMQQSGNATARIDSSGYVQPGVSTTLGHGSTVGGSKLTSGPGAPTGMAGTLGDLYIRTDGGDGSWIYRCTTAGVAGAAVWTAKL